MRAEILLILLALWATSALLCAPDQPSKRNSTHDSGLAWVGALIPAEGGRDSLRYVAAEAIHGGVEVTCELTHPDIRGKPTTGQVKLFLPDSLRDNPDGKLPLIHAAGYELDRPGGEALLAAGVVLSTPHADPDNPLIRGENLDVAILHRVRTLPFVDDARVRIIGGSAGGYMTLMLAAETFPLNCCVPDVPPVNTAYNMAYLAHNKAVAEAQPEGQDHQNMPILAAVCMLVDPAGAIYGTGHDADAWLMASPITRLDEVTCPTLITCSTADILVPINQMGAELARPHDPARFPAGFEICVDRLVAGEKARLTFLETVPADKVAVFHVAVPETAPPIGWDGLPGPGESTTLPMPFSKSKLFSLVVLEEGPVEPQCGHQKRIVDTRKDEFLRHYAEAPIAPGQLTLQKLQRLMLRYLHEEAHPATVQPPDAPAPFMANRMDFAELERADVLRGLRTFASDPGCAQRLVELYAALPPKTKALGADFAEGGTEAMVARLKGLEE